MRRGVPYQGRERKSHEKTNKRRRVGAVASAVRVVVRNGVRRRARADVRATEINF